MNEDNNADEFDPEYQTGKSTVSHNNIDASGDGHPLGNEALDFEANLRTLIRKVADDLYESWEATVREYLANAETACLRVENHLADGEDTVATDSLYGVDDGYSPKIEVTYDKSEERLTIRDNGIGMASKEVDEVFRKIGNSAARDAGNYSGQFGMGVLSFVKLIGVDNSMVMSTHSRQTDENFACYVSLAGPEPVMGGMSDDQYGTEFQLTPNDDYDIRSAVETYAEYIRVPVIYREFDESGEEVYNEDWGDKTFVDDYDENMVTMQLDEPGAFTAYCSSEASGESLLLSMPIERTMDQHSLTDYGAPFSVDIRLHDESGKVFESTNGNEGLMPVARHDYEEMLKNARDGYITESLLASGDVTGRVVEDGPNEGAIVLDKPASEFSKPLPAGKNYIVEDDVSDDDTLGSREVVFSRSGNEGRTIVSEDEWESMDAGRAEQYVPEDELESYDVSTGEGDLRLPEPTSDRDRLQSNEVFWEYVGTRFKNEFEEEVVDLFKKVEQSDNPVETVMEMEPENLVIQQ